MPDIGFGDKMASKEAVNEKEGKEGALGNVFTKDSMPLDRQADRGAEIREYRKAYKELLRESRDLRIGGKQQDAVEAARKALYAAIRIADAKYRSQNENSMGDAKLDIMDRYRIWRASEFIFKEDNGKISSAGYTIMAGLATMWAGAFELQWALGAGGAYYPIEEFARRFTEGQLHTALWYPLAIFAGTVIEGTGIFVTAVGAYELWAEGRKITRKKEKGSYKDRLDRVFHPVSEEKLKKLEEDINKGEFKA